MSRHENETALDKNSADALLKNLEDGWALNDEGTMLSRRFEFKGFAKAVYLSNLCVYIADREAHHPDIAFGWGYCQVNLTTHDIGGLSESDFSWAAILDKHIASP